MKLKSLDTLAQLWMVVNQQNNEHALIEYFICV